MAAVRSAEADRFIAAPPRQVFVFLVFGSDAGLVSERIRKLVAKSVDDPNDPFQLVRLDADRLASDPVRLVDEVNTVPLLGGRRAVLIEAGGKNIAPAVEPVLAAEPGDCTVLIEAGVMKRDAPLRALVERASRGATIECLPDDEGSIARLIAAEARAAGLEIAEDARDALVQLLGVDRLTTRSEIEKLVLYAHGTGRITLADVEAVVADASAVALATAVDGAFLGDFAAIEATLPRVFAEGGDPGMLLGAALRHAIALHRGRLDVEARRAPADVARAGARFGIFAQRQKPFERQLAAWSAARIARAIDILADAVARCRREPRLGEAIAVRALWTLALSASSRAA